MSGPGKEIPAGDVEAETMFPGQITIHTDIFTPRNFQVELLDTAKQKNTIVCLDTGTGKTFIAVMLIKELAHDIRHPWEDGAKRTFFLVPTVPLVQQQGGVVERHTGLKVGQFIGAMGVDLWKDEQWTEQFKKYPVLVMTAQIFLDILLHGFLKLSRVNLIVFDECHHAKNNHPYKQIMKMFDMCAFDQRPRVLGLTASVVSTKCHPSKVSASIHQLESALGCTAETSSDLLDISRYGARPHEYVIYYPLSVKDPARMEILSLLARNIQFLEDAKLKLEEKPEDEKVQEPLVIPKTVLRETQYILTHLGPWCCDKVALWYIRDLEKLLKRFGYIEINRMFMQYTQTVLRTVRKLCHDSYLKELVDGVSLLKFASPKLRRLVEIFAEYKPSEEEVAPPSEEKPSRRDRENDDSLCGIVFVEHRSTANAVCSFLRELSNRDANLGFIKAEFVVGHGTQSASKESVMRFRQQEEVLKKFRNHESNLLIATSVIEEGVDVPHCNLVVRFDLPKEYRSYVQSKGRARKSGARFVMLIPEGDMDDFRNDLKNYHATEEILLSQCQDRQQPTEEDIDASLADQYLPPYMPVKGDGQARVTMSSAIGLVNRYCARLPSDAFTHLTPLWKIRRVNVDGKMPLVECTLHLPINSPIKYSITGEPMPTVKLARMAVSLKTCMKLHQAGELDNHLLPVGKEAMKCEIEEEIEGEEIADGMPRPGTTKRRQYYYKQIADALKGCHPTPGEHCFLYIISMELSRPITEEQNTRGREIYHPEDTPQCFGILTSKEVLQLPEFPVYTRSGEVSISIELVASEFTLMEDQLQRLSLFHYFTFSSVLRLDKPPMQYNHTSDDCASYIVVPLNIDNECGYSIDWQFIEHIASYQSKPRVLPSQRQTKFEFDPDQFHEAVVSPSYRNLDQPQYFYVAEIRRDLTPLSSFPSDNFPTFSDYFSKKYSIAISSIEQPLLDVDHTSARLNLLTPRYLNRKGMVLPASVPAESKKTSRDDLQKKQLLVPELCDVHPFPAPLWRKAVCLPCILYRMNCLLLAEQLRVRVAKEARIGLVQLPDGYRYPRLDFGWQLSEVKEEEEVDTSDGEADDGAEEEEEGELEITVWRAEDHHMDEINATQSSFTIPEVYPYDDDYVVTDEEYLLQGVIVNYRGLFNKSDGFFTNLGEMLDESPSGSDAEEYVGAAAAAAGGRRSKRKVKEAEAGSVTKKITHDGDVCDTCGAKRKGGRLISEKHVCDIDDDEQIAMAVAVGADPIDGDDKGPGFGEALMVKPVVEEEEIPTVSAFEASFDLENHPGPSPCMILQALTMSNANDGINLERLEMIGDSFLKQAITVYLYMTYPHVNEGKLSYARSKQVSNLNLYRLGKKKNLGEIMVATKFEPTDNWLPPGYYIPDNREKSMPDVRPIEGLGQLAIADEEHGAHAEVAEAAVGRTDDPSTQELTEMGRQQQEFHAELEKRREEREKEEEVVEAEAAFIPYNLQTQHSIPDKSIADCVEALIGCYLIECGPRAALMYMSWLGLKVLPKPEAGVEQPKSPLIPHPNAEQLLNFYLDGFDKFEEHIGYTFKDRSYLLQAFTHASYHYNTITDCYQRIEFLGDAILDYLITRHLYEDHRQHSPGALTDLRSALVNNAIFAALAVKFDYHHYFKAISPDLFRVIDKYVKMQKEKETAGCDVVFTDEDLEEGEEVETPKALGDVFESVAGAIYLDSNMSLSTVWRVYYRMMKPEIDHFTANVPKSPIRELLEMEPENTKFEKPVRLSNKVRVEVHIFHKGTFTGIGRNSRIAKCTAAKRALHALKELKRQEGANT